MRAGGIGTAIYLIIGAVVAQDHRYFSHLADLDRIVSMVIAVLLWPLVLLGANLHLNF